MFIVPKFSYDVTRLYSATVYEFPANRWAARRWMREEAPPVKSASGDSDVYRNQKPKTLKFRPNKLLN
jgi:hypothetical protein